MLDLIKKVMEELLADSTITDFVDDRVYTAFKPVGNTVQEFPQITMALSDDGTDSILETYDLSFQIHIWTKGDARFTRGHEIAKRVLLNLDIAGFEGVSPVPCIYQIWKESSVDIFEDDTQTFHKVITFSVVMDSYK